jgi:hypothetical protein
MIARYRIVSERLRSELKDLALVVDRAEEAAERAQQHPDDERFYLTAAAFELHSFYTGLERLFELVAREIDERLPSGPAWHRELLTQMSLSLLPLRPAVIATETLPALEEYLGFRHIVRNIYAFHLRPGRVAELTHDLRPAFKQVQRDLQVLIQFLENMSTADENESNPQSKT